MNKTQDITLTTIGVISTGSAYLIKKNIASLSYSQALNLQSTSISAFDKPAIDYRSETALHLSDAGQYISLALPLSIFAFQPSKKELLTQLVILQEVALITTGLTHITKGLTLRSRPYAYRDDTPLAIKQSPDSRTSFFSGHTAITAAMSFYTASIISAYSDNSTFKTSSWIGAVILPSAVGYLRVRAGEHFYTDVIVAGIVGGGIGWLIPKLHLIKNNSQISILPITTDKYNGLYLTCRF